MKSNIAHALAEFLEVFPYQVLAWDHKVIDHMVRNSELFRNFQQGGSRAKWDIYSHIKYGSLM
ncbi:MAG TPA: hypothetical protein VGK14_10625 [Novimethylophilus sp.]|jgi:flagellar biosynthesis regulator FlbT|uniref:hypothetical protein n=1 Tax=Novimethylophilus sp. TaxID=2137426 RepID=UPI002F41211D